MRIGVNGVDRSECIGGGEWFWLFGRTIKGNWVGVLWLVVTIHPPPSRDHTPMRSVAHHPIYSPAAEKREEKAEPRLITCDQLKIDELWISWCTELWKLISIDFFENDRSYLIWNTALIEKQIISRRRALESSFQCFEVIGRNPFNALNWNHSQNNVWG